MKRIFILVLLSICSINLVLAQKSNVIDPELYELMNSRSSDKISVNIILKKQIDASELNLRKSYSSKDAMRKGMMEEMKYQAEKNQADVVKTLQASERSSQVTDINCHWLTNMINCKATADAILKIAEHPDVEAVIYNKEEYMLFDEKKESGTPTRAYNGTNVEKINAHKVWEMGFTGEGIVVAVIDTGVNADHVDLKDHLWSDSQGRHGWNTLSNSANIADGDGHGTHCAGTVCGDGTSGTITGMAPDAKLMTVKALGDTGEGTLESLVSGIEYAVQNGADVLSMSLGFSYPSAYINEAMRNVLANTLPMGIVAAVAAGNDGAKQSSYPIPRNINAPGTCPPPWIHPDQQSNAGGLTSVISVGAVNYSDVACNFSSEGPVTWQNTSYSDYRMAAGYPTKTLRYDNSDYTGSWSYQVARTFGVMFPPAMLSEFSNGGIVTSVSIHTGLGDSGFMTIYSGGNTPDNGNATALHTQGYSFNPDGEMYEIVLDKEVQIDVTKNLWVVFESYLDGSPIPVASNTDNANGRWVKVDGKWTNSNAQVTEMIKIHVNISTSNEQEDEKIGLIRPDVCAPGYDIMSASNTDNEWYDWMSGTSMATPCVAGAIALLLDANPDLTPARICQVLEETSVKLSTTKSNKTGTGRINIYDAVLEVADIPLTAPVLTATAASTSSVNLSWTKAGADTYTVYRGNTVIASNLTSTTYTDSGLNAETSYCYTVKAFKGTESKTSNEACATTLAESSGQQYRIRVSSTGHSQYGKYLYADSYTLPSDNVPTLLVTSYAESNTQIFTLEDAGNGNYYLRTADGYYVKCGTTSIGKYWNTYAYSATEKTPLTLQYVDDVNFYIRDYDKTTGTGHSTSMPNNNYFKVENGKIYCDAPSTNTDVVTWVFELVGGTTPEPEPEPTPTAPSAPTLTAAAQSTTAIKLTWNAVTDATSYNVYREGSKIASVATGTTYSDTGLNPNTQYCYRVTAVNSVGESAQSNEACATTQAETPAVPSTPTNLTATAQSTTAIGLSWNSVSGATSYKVYREGTYLIVVTGTTYSDTGLTPNTQYCYKVTAVNSAGESAKSNEACATTEAENTGGGGGSDGEVEIGYPTTNNDAQLPIYAFYEYSYSQQIYTAAEINKDADFTGSMITRIAFKQSNNVIVSRNIVVYMQNITAATTSFASEKGWINVTDNTKVFEGTITTSGQNQYLEIRLDTPMEYTGGNLLISVFDKTGVFSKNYPSFYCYAVNDRSLQHKNMVLNFDPKSMGTLGGSILNKNNAINITFEAAEAVIPFPQNVKANPTNIFVDQSTTVSWDACAGASSYNIYVNDIKQASTPTTSYVLSNLQYNLDPGEKINVTAVVGGEESEMSNDVFVKVAAYFPLEINVVDAQGNPMQDVVIVLDGHNEFGNVISETYISDANGNVTVEKMPIPLFNTCYDIAATKSVYKGYASICDYNNPPMNVEKDVRYVLTIVMELPVPELSSNKDSYAVNENIGLSWEWREALPADVTPSGYNLYEKYWDERSGAYIYEKINTSLIPANQLTYTITGGLPLRGCDNTICLTVDYSGNETSKDLSTVTVSKTGNGTMDGIVVDGGGNPVSGVTVTVKGKDCEGNAIPDYTYTTGTNGKFGQSNMPMGIYTIFAVPPQGSGYNDRYVYNVEIVHDNTTTVVIELWEGGDAIEIEREIGENPAPYIDADGPMLPISNGFLYSASQQIYTREELNFASATDVKITSISFKVYGNENKGAKDYIRIFMQNIEKDEFGRLNDWTSFTMNDAYYDGNYTVPSDGEWVTLKLTQPFSYTGGNIIIGAHRHYDPLDNQTNFYVCETETMRSLCACDPTFDPITTKMNGTALYKINNIKITYTSTSPEVVITPDPIEFGEVIVGDYWREKPDVTVPVQIESYNSIVESVTIDEPFFTLPNLGLPKDEVLEFEMGYDRINGTPGYKYGIMTVTPNKGVVKGVKTTATAYDPVEPDVFEKSREVVWENDEYEDTPDFATLHDDYILPGENPEGNRYDAVYRFTLDEDATLTAEVLNGSNPLIAFYKEDFANGSVDKDGPSSDNYYYYGAASVMEDLSFSAGTYYAVPAAETNFTFRLTRVTDDKIIFIGVGDWHIGSNWNIGREPHATEDAIIRGDAVVNDNVYVNSIFIESVGTLTIADGGVIEVIEGIENTLHSAFIIEDGGQLYQNAADVAATLNMNINNPATWGPDGSNHANGWQFIASPFLDADLLGYVNPDEGGDYDLYKYDGTRYLEWVNYKLHHDEFIHDFSDGMQDWTVLDANGDGYTWSYNGGAGKDGAAGYLSCAFNSGASNDYLVSPKIINTYPESKLRFWVKNAKNVTTTSEVEVWLSADKAAAPTTAGDFITKVGTVTVTNEWQQVEFLLEAYADQDDRDFMEYWMAIRCTSGASSNTEVMIDHLELANYEEANPYETEFILGRGYMASYEKDGEATIQGILNHERTFNYKVAFNADDRWENFYLLGNPFPYNISWSNFTHSGIVNGFAVVDNDGSYVYDVDADIKVGDGIMIMTTGSNPTVSVTKNSRNEVADHINVVASGADGDDNFIVSLSGDSDGFKKLENFNKDIAQIYVSEYGTHYGIVNRDADVEEVEFCFNASKMGRYTITVTPSGEFSRISLYDRVENVETDMLADNTYKFFATNSTDNRFVLRFSTKPADEEGFFVYQSGDELVIDAEGMVQIVDVMGRVLYSGEQSGVRRVSVSGMENSACVVRNINNNEVRTQKIVIL